MTQLKLLNIATMDVEASDAGEPRLLESSHRALSDGLSGFVNPSDIRALRVVSKTAHEAMGTVEWNHFDLDPDNSPVIKVCADDN